jgi:hypothetical protein
MQYTNNTTVESQFTGVVEDNPKKSLVNPATGANAIQLQKVKIWSLTRYGNRGSKNGRRFDYLHDETMLSSMMMTTPIHRRL